MHECMYASMYVLYAYIHVCMHICVYACMYICMHVCIHVCDYVIFKLGFERYGGNCPSWEGELSGGNCPEGSVRGNCPGGSVRALHNMSIYITVVYVDMYAGVHRCMYICNFQVGFERLGGELSKLGGELSEGEMSVPRF